MSFQEPKVKTTRASKAKAQVKEKKISKRGPKSKAGQISEATPVQNKEKQEVAKTVKVDPEQPANDQL
jgi:hypothetical protein